MKTKIILLSLCFSLVFFSCKNEPKNEPKTEVKEDLPPTFDVAVDLVIPSDEELILFYKDGTNEWFEEDKAVWASVKGNAAAQTVIFNMPEGVMPTDLRFDIGRNEYKGLKNIEIKKMSMSYLNNKFEIPQEKFGMYFKPNQYITFDEATKLYSFKTDEKGNYDAFFETTPALYPEFAKVAAF